MNYIQIRSLIFILALTFTVVACSETNTTGPDTNAATVEGRVEGDTDTQNKYKAVEGATVTAARVAADGSLETISGAEAKTDASGDFSLNINPDEVADSEQSIVILAESENSQWKAFVTGQLESGSTVKVQPLTVESSGEADVFAQIVAEGEADIVTRADIEAYIGSEASAQIRNNAQAASSFAAALIAEASARSSYFADQSVDITEDQKQNIMEAKVQAQAQLESNLDAAGSAEEEQAAMDAFLQAITEAYVNSEVNASVYAEAKELSGRVLLKNSTSLSSSARSELRTHTALLTSYAIAGAVRARMEAAGATDQSIQAASQAAVTLRSDLKAAGNATASEVDAAFETYNQAIVDIMKQEFSANAEIIAEVNSEINGVGSAKATFESSIGTTADTNVLVEVYSTFYSSVAATVDSTFSSATETEAQFVTDIMILINLAN